MADVEKGPVTAAAADVAAPSPVATANGGGDHEAATTTAAAKKGRGHSNRRKGQSTSDKHTDLVDADVEKEFLTLMAKMKKTHIGQHLVYQINNYVEGIECTFRISRDQIETPFTRDFNAVGHKEKQPGGGKEGRNSHTTTTRGEPKELTPEQKAKLDARKEKRRLAKRKNFEKKMAARAAEKCEEAAAEIPAGAAVDANAAAKEP